MIAGMKVKLGGTEWVVPPLNLGALIDMQEGLKDFKPNAMDPASVKLVLDCAYRALRRNYPDITMEFLQEHIDLGNMFEVMQAVMDVSGLRRKKKEADETAGETLAVTSSAGQT